MYALAILREFLHRNAYKNTRAALFAFGPRGPHAKGSARIYSIIVSDLYVLRILVVASTKIATIDEYICVGSVVGSIEAVMIQQNT